MFKRKRQYVISYQYQNKTINGFGYSVFDWKGKIKTYELLDIQSKIESSLANKGEQYLYASVVILAISKL